LKEPTVVRLADVPEDLRERLVVLECPTFAKTPFAAGPPLAERRVALITTAGLTRRDDRPFGSGSNDYRIIPGDVRAKDLVMSHGSTNYDRTGFQQDLNTVFPIDRLRELAEAGVVGSVASYHYSFMGSTEPMRMEPAARHLAGLLKEDRVNAVILTPV
jgi:D-proline reductase (dithiol) PrdB